MRPAIVATAVGFLLATLALDRLWPVWPVHIPALVIAVVVVALAILADIAARPR